MHNESQIYAIFSEAITAPKEAPSTDAMGINKSLKSKTINQLLQSIIRERQIWGDNLRLGYFPAEIIHLNESILDIHGYFPQLILLMFTCLLQLWKLRLQRVCLKRDNHSYKEFMAICTVGNISTQSMGWLSAHSIPLFPQQKYIQWDILCRADIEEAYFVFFYSKFLWVWLQLHALSNITTRSMSSCSSQLVAAQHMRGKDQIISCS